ncbi:hypothetical protein EYR40_009290 [Pleurotus pulmonarius]|nr:hypothetical protein EYR36_005339 [Pleurotus pulmonarius]KAF4590694.1 hypothetical protein EYR40_009290 [Pleurotus pulmonarius]
MPVPRDVQLFLDDYPGEVDDPSQSANLEFYTNKKRCAPDNLLIEEIHDKWSGDYETLERNHGFIQWLFPIQEHGMNYRSQPLRRHEIHALKSNPEAISRILGSYRLMLDFYGMRLVSKETGMLSRTLPPRNYAARYKNLCRSTHNNLRISRILKCLSEFGLEHLNAGFLLHVLNEQTEHGELNTYSIRSSMDSWWSNCIRNEDERNWISQTIREARSDVNPLVFTRDMYESALRRREMKGSLREETS